MNFSHRKYLWKWWKWKYLYKTLRFANFYDFFLFQEIFYNQLVSVKQFLKPIFKNICISWMRQRWTFNHPTPIGCAISIILEGHHLQPSHVPPFSRSLPLIYSLSIEVRENYKMKKHVILPFWMERFPMSRGIRMRRSQKEGKRNKPLQLPLDDLCDALEAFGQ